MWMRADGKYEVLFMEIKTFVKMLIEIVLEEYQIEYFVNEN